MNSRSQLPGLLMMIGIVVGLIYIYDIVQAYSERTRPKIESVMNRLDPANDVNLRFPATDIQIACDTNCIQIVSGAVDMCQGEPSKIIRSRITVSSFSTEKGEQFKKTSYNVEALCQANDYAQKEWAVYDKVDDAEKYRYEQKPGPDSDRIYDSTQP